MLYFCGMTQAQQIVVEIPVSDPALQDLLIALLADAGYEGFEQEPELLKAYIPEPDFHVEVINEILNQHDLTYSKSVIEKQNWNAVWESNFDPVRIADFVAIRAAFHAPATRVRHEIIITPKMSFGTGHHATTYTVMQLMEEMDFRGKSVFDFGTGTGILAILAEKLGASRLLAVDNDDWCIENASENISINHCQYIDIQKVDTAHVSDPFDIVIANINKNIILDNMDQLAVAVKPGGEVVLSGLLLEDEADILLAGRARGWTHLVTRDRSGWIAMRFRN